MKNFMRNNIKSVTLVFATTISLLSFQNCGPAYINNLSLSSLASSGSLNLNPGAYKQNPFQCAAPTVQAVSPIQRMTRNQYVNNLKRLVGNDGYNQAATLINSLYEDTLKKSVTDFSNTISDNQMTAYEVIASAILNYVKNTPVLVQQLGGSCFQQTTITDTCRNSAIKNIGLLAFHRPWTDTEVQQWSTNVYTQGATPAESLAFSVYAMMLSPEFLMHVEVGTPSSDTSNSYDLTPYEVAARISYGTTDAPPDQELMTAAAQGQLSTIAQVTAHVDRLIQSPESKIKVRNFFTYWLDPRRYSASNFAPKFSDGLDVNAANDEFSREMNEFIDYIVFTKKGSFEDLIQGSESFARTPAVAAIYGHTAVTGSTPASVANSRKGLLMRTPVIATDGNETHPILRGVKFRNRFLCESFGLPSGINTNDPTFFSDEARIRFSTRVRTAGITAGTSCMGCHASINPVGFAFEGFDSLGRVRPIEKSYSSAGEVLAEHPIDTASPHLNLGARDIAVQDATGLVDAMMQENILPGCFVKQVSRFYRIQQESADDACLFGSVYDKAITKPGTPVLEVFRQQFLTNNIFKRRMN